ncbi:zinc finger MYND domain-containing protein 10 [Chrysoperla carnea]|uniref:zinc finger MYND domain-containing protein 10 n=1 Tax=Chrysoperla carnea TaxID=189513 RepID=UPI001D072A22|nr:zinc finger MYND domain-containing protein 10 [Chrysoperla carnea]
MTENVLLASEAEFYINNISIGTIEDIGTKKWINWHQRLQKLNQQAVLEASELREEAIKEFLVSYNKLSILVHEAILMSVWRTKILPRLLKLQPEPENTFFLYSALYHEATAISLLEIVLYHADSCEVLNDVVLDLIDYVYDAITCVIALKSKIKTSVTDGENITDIEQIVREEFPRQRDNLVFDIGMRCISIIFHIIVNVERFPLCATNRMLTTLDVPLLLVQLIEDKPWIKVNSKNETLHYIEGKWKVVTGEAEMKLTGHEAHVWLALRQILMNSNTPNIYEYNEYRKNQLIRLQKYLTEVVLDQIPPLIDLKQWLCQLSVSDPPSQKKPIIIELVPEIKQKILSSISKKLKSMTITHAKRFFTTNKDELLEIANSLNDAYNTDFLEKMIEKSENNQGQICAGCGRNGLKKCSKCKNEWYCGRECQVNHWPQHKENCLAN